MLPQYPWVLSPLQTTTGQQKHIGITTILLVVFTPVLRGHTQNIKFTVLHTGADFKDVQVPWNNAEPSHRPRYSLRIHRDRDMNVECDPRVNGEEDPAGCPYDKKPPEI